VGIFPVAKKPPLQSGADFDGTQITEIICNDFRFHICVFVSFVTLPFKTGQSFEFRGKQDGRRFLG